MPEPTRMPEVMKWWQEQRKLYDGKTPLEVGQKVLTKEPKYILAGDWTEEALKERRYGVLGEVTKLQRGHGLCYKVRHTDGSEAFYDPWELEVQDG